MKFSEYYKLGKSQFELDFVDIDLERDSKMFIDPWALRQNNDSFSSECHTILVDFFDRIIQKIRTGKLTDARMLLENLHEPRETHLGLCVDGYQGSAVADSLSELIFDSLKDSQAVRTGMIQDLEDCALLIPGIGRDKISDIVTNLIRLPLIKYTQEQCMLYGIPMEENIPTGWYWDIEKHSWEKTVATLPVPIVQNRKKILLVPKSIVKKILGLDPEDYYNREVVEMDRDIKVKSGVLLVQTLKDGRTKLPTKKSVKELHPKEKKDFLYQFTRDNPEALRKYKDRKTTESSRLENEEISFLVEGKEPDTESIISEMIEKLRSIPKGRDGATEYHRHIAGILSLIFYPHLVNIKTEEEIHDGRKRIDITFDNDAKSGFFDRLGKRAIACAKIMLECKNYGKDVSNPELDQLSGRFSYQKGVFGVLLCREIQNEELLIKRTIDTQRDKRGTIIFLTDDDIIKLLEFKKENEENEINSFLEEKLIQVLS